MLERYKPTWLLERKAHRGYQWLRHAKPYVEELEERALLSLSIINFDNQPAGAYPAGPGVDFAGSRTTVAEQVIIPQPSWGPVFPAHSGTHVVFGDHNSLGKIYAAPDLPNHNWNRVGVFVTPDADIQVTLSALRSNGTLIKSVSSFYIPNDGFSPIVQPPANQLLQISASGIASVIISSKTTIPNIILPGTFAIDDFFFDTVTPPKLPDIAMDSAVLTGSTIQYTYNTTNDPGPFSVGLYQSADTVFDASDVLVDTQSVTPAANSAGTWFFRNVKLSTTQPNLLVVADPPDFLPNGTPTQGAIAEANETNNVALVPLQLTQLKVTSSAVYTVTAGAYTITAAMPTLVTGSIDPAFMSAFNSWNASVGNTWVLVNGGALRNTVFNAVTYAASVTSSGNADLEIQINYIQGSGPAPIPSSGTISNSDAVWIQSISTNDKLTGALPGNPYLDNPSTAPNPNLPPPAYSFQYSTSYFYDHPMRFPGVGVNWEAIDYISTVNYSTHTVTVYDGVAYGFTVTKPAPVNPLGLLVNSSGLVYNRATQLFGGTITLRRCC